MKFFFTFLITVFCSLSAFAQSTNVKSEILNQKQVETIFSDSVCKSLNIKFDIFRVYKYSDKTGAYYCILTESRDAITENNDTLHHKIKALNLKIENQKLTKVWEINDAIIKNENDENSIWFWTKYIDFKDYNNSGIAVPIIVYGTAERNGYHDGRIKFIIYYKGQKIAIRHQNGILDDERETQVDQAFYILPQSLQANIKQKMALMKENDHAIFPAGWQSAMKNKKSSFNERL